MWSKLSKMTKKFETINFNSVFTKALWLILSHCVQHCFNPFCCLHQTRALGRLATNRFGWDVKGDVSKFLKEEITSFHSGGQKTVSAIKGQNQPVMSA